MSTSWMSVGLAFLLAVELLGQTRSAMSSSGCVADSIAQVGSASNFLAFSQVLEEVAAGWNSGDARRAAACFSPDAVYTAAGQPGVRRGRAALYQFFGGPEGRDAPMIMTWHHMGFDTSTQVGFGEYTFRFKNYQAHGVVVVRLRGGQIANWKEYEIASQESWDRFSSPNRF